MNAYFTVHRVFGYILSVNQLAYKIVYLFDIYLIFLFWSVSLFTFFFFLHLSTTESKSLKIIAGWSSRVVYKWHVLRNNLFAESPISPCGTESMIGSYQTLMWCMQRREYPQARQWNQIKRRFNWQDNDEFNCLKLNTLHEMSFFHPSLHRPSVNFAYFVSFPFLVCLPSQPLQALLPSPLPLQLAACWADWTFAVRCWILSQIPCINLKHHVKHSSIESNSLWNMWSICSSL